MEQLLRRLCLIFLVAPLMSQEPKQEQPKQQQTQLTWPQWAESMEARVRSTTAELAAQRKALIEVIDGLRDVPQMSRVASDIQQRSVAIESAVNEMKSRPIAQTPEPAKDNTVWAQIGAIASVGANILLVIAILLIHQLNQELDRHRIWNAKAAMQSGAAINETGTLKAPEQADPSIHISEKG